MPDNKYVPDPVAAVKSLEEFMVYVQQELQKIAQTTGQTLPQTLEELSAPPVREVERMLVLADGVHWDPGSGRGVYIRLGGKWVPMGTVGVPLGEEPPPVEEPPVGEPVVTIFDPEGFGKIVTGGKDKPIVHVTHLLDSGAGSFREAISAGDRQVVFDIGGDINLQSNLFVGGPNITIDCLTAPSPGITLRGREFVMQASRNANNVILRGLRSRSSPGDGIRVFGARKILIDRCSVSGFSDGACDISEEAADVTIQWCIFGPGLATHNQQQLIGYRSQRVSALNNLYFQGKDRHPRVTYDTNNPGLDSPEIVADVRNNVIWEFIQHGTQCSTKAKVNVVGNFYKPGGSLSDLKTLFVAEGALVYAEGNYSTLGHNLNDNGNQAEPFAAVAPTVTYSATAAAHRVKANAGARGDNFTLDATDQGFVDALVGLPPA